MKRFRPILVILTLLILWPLSVGPVAWAEWNAPDPSEPRALGAIIAKRWSHEKTL